MIESTNFRNLKMNACSRMGYIDTEQAVKAAVERMKAVREAVVRQGDQTPQQERGKEDV